jgi:hypothetical protein
MLLEILAVLALQAAAPQSVASGGPECAVEGACRKVGTVTFKADGKTAVFRINRDLPWVTQGNVLLFPGEAVVVALDDVNGQLQPRLVASGAAVKGHALKPGELSFSFDIRPEGSILRTESAHPSAIHYGAMMVGPDNRSQPTSICPVRSGKFVLEHWPHPIVQLALSNFRAVDLSKGVGCS